VSASPAAASPPCATGPGSARWAGWPTATTGRWRRPARPAARAGGRRSGLVRKSGEVLASGWAWPGAARRERCAGEPGGEGPHGRRARRTETALLERCLDPRTGLFLDLAGRGERPVPVSTWSALAPLALGDAIPADVRLRLAEEHLLHPRRYRAACGIPSVAMEEPAFNPAWNRFRTWRGPSWVNTAWLLVPGLDALGLRTEGDRILPPWRGPRWRAGCASTTTRTRGPGSARATSAGRRCSTTSPPLAGVDGGRPRAAGRGAARRRRGRRGAGIVRRMKLLVLTPEPIDADFLRATLGDEVDGAEVFVVSPATNQSGLAFWVSDPDDAIREAETAQVDTVERLEEEDIDAAGTTGESEPALALQDAMATFPADRILIVSHPEGDRDYREDHGLADAEARFGVPVTHATISR